MHLWNPKALAVELAARRVSERQKCGYLLATFGLSWAWGLLAFFRGDGARSSFWWQEGFSALLVLVYAAGTWIAFRIYQKGAASDFVAAYTCLSVPSAIRAVVISVSFFCVLTVAVALATQPYSEWFAWLYDAMGYVLAVLIHGLYFYFLWTAIKTASAPPEPQAIP